MKEALKNATIIDVRTPGEFAQKHYPEAINIPLDRLPQHVAEIREMNKPVVAYCRSGNRSGMAVSILKQNGLQEVYNGGGLEEMLQENYR